MLDRHPEVLALALAVALFGVKQLAADFVLQPGWMARGKGRATEWHAPLLAHAAVHAGGTLILALALAPAWWWLAAVDLGLHALIDRLRAMRRLGGRWRPDQPVWWWVFGLDQELHHLTHLGFALLLVAG